MKTILCALFKRLISSRSKNVAALRREHNDTLYYMRHGKMPTHAHPDDMKE